MQKKETIIVKDKTNRKLSNSDDLELIHLNMGHKGQKANKPPSSERKQR